MNLNHDDQNISGSNNTACLNIDDHSVVVTLVNGRFHDLVTLMDNTQATNHFRVIMLVKIYHKEPVNTVFGQVNCANVIVKHRTLVRPKPVEHRVVSRVERIGRRVESDTRKLRNGVAS